MTTPAPEATLRLVIDLVIDATPITGTLRGPDGVVHEFCGWIELTQAVDGLRRPPTSVA